MFNSCVSVALYRPLEQKVQKHVRPHFKLGAEVPECLALEPRPNDESREDETTSCGKAISRVSYTEGYVTHAKTVDNSTSGDVIADGNRYSRIRDIIRYLCTALDISLWKDWCFVLYALSQAFSTMANKSVFIFTPAVAIDNGMSDSQSAYIIVSDSGRRLRGSLYVWSFLRPVGCATSSIQAVQRVYVFHDNNHIIVAIYQVVRRRDHQRCLLRFL